MYTNHKFMTEEEKRQFHFNLNYSKLYNYDLLLDFSEYGYYIEDHPKNRVLDIGFGIGQSVIYFAKKQFNVLAVDKHQYRKEILIESIEKNKLCDKNLIEFMMDDFFNIDFKNEKFSVIIATNIIHFFDENECKLFFDKINELLEINGVLYLLAHHLDHPDNHKAYFKQFFDRDTINSYLKSENYQTLKYSYSEAKISKMIKRFTQKVYLKTGFPYHPEIREIDKKTICLILKKIN